MSRSEEGEYELVLGNRQLLSIVFILMVLFGIVFSAGYFVGRNSAPQPVASAAAPPPIATLPTGSTAPQPGSAAHVPAEAPTPEAVGTAEKSPESGVATGQSAQSQAPAPEAERPPAPTAAAESPYPEPGPNQSFLQVAAVRRAEAELVADVLKKKGFPAAVAPGPSDTIFRVLVGPLKDSASLAKTKVNLEAAGFKSIVRKY